MTSLARPEQSRFKLAAIVMIKMLLNTHLLEHESTSSMPAKTICNARAKSRQPEQAATVQECRARGKSCWTYQSSQAAMRIGYYAHTCCATTGNFHHQIAPHGLTQPRAGMLPAEQYQCFCQAAGARAQQLPSPHVCIFLAGTQHLHMHACMHTCLAGACISVMQSACPLQHDQSILQHECDGAAPIRYWDAAACRACTCSA